MVLIALGVYLYKAFDVWVIELINVINVLVTKRFIMI